MENFRIGLSPKRLIKKIIQREEDAEMTKVNMQTSQLGSMACGSLHRK